MAVSSAQGNYWHECYFIWYFQKKVYTSLPTRIHSQNSARATEEHRLKNYHPWKTSNRIMKTIPFNPTELSKTVWWDGASIFKLFCWSLWKLRHCKNQISKMEERSLLNKGYDENPKEKTLEKLYVIQVQKVAPE